jgi:hypothetical protein
MPASFGQSPKAFYDKTPDDYDDSDTIESVTDLPINITSYLTRSDGNSLNTTLWLSQPIKDSEYDKYLNSNLTFTLNIYSHDTFNDDKELAYKVIIFPKTYGWVKQLIELEPDSDYYSGFERVLSESNYTGFYKNNANYVGINLDLKEISFPKSYSIDPETSAERNGEKLNDSVLYTTYPIGANNVFFRYIENPLILYPGEEKKINYYIDALDLQSLTNLTLEDSKDQNGFTISFVPQTINLPKNGTELVEMKVKADQSLPPKSYQLRINTSYAYLDGHPKNESESINVKVRPPRPIFEQVARFLTSVYAYLWLPLLVTTIIAGILYSKAKYSVIFEDLKVKDIVGFNSAIIAGVLVFLSIGGGSNYFIGGVISQTGILTASIVMPFSMSAISVIVTGKINTGMKYALAGFVYLIAAVILISIPPIK